MGTLADLPRSPEAAGKMEFGGTATHPLPLAGRSVPVIAAKAHGGLGHSRCNAGGRKGRVVWEEAPELSVCLEVVLREENSSK